jgi:formate C-acetyltransferase
MYYLWNAGEVGATADGRKAREPFGANFSPAIGVRPAGPLSVIQSFTKQHLSDAINGGPLTLELHDTLFRNRQGIEKTAQLVKLFIDRGGHQIQLNAVSRDTLLDAQNHPEQYRNLIVRVWGWSGYFVELDKPYQDHIISRVEFMA